MICDLEPGPGSGSGRTRTVCMCSQSWRRVECVGKKRRDGYLVTYTQHTHIHIIPMYACMEAGYIVSQAEGTESRFGTR